jgi:hypothetical protein
MANPYLVLWCDPNNNVLYSGWNENSQATTPILKQGDTIGVEIHWVNRGEFSSPMKEIQFPPSATVTLAIGLLDVLPSSGTFTITYGSDTTAAIPYNVTATSLQTALNGLESISEEGGVTVTKTNNQYKIVWNEMAVSTTEIEANTDNLSPLCVFSSKEARAGSPTASRVLLFKISQAPVAGTSTFTRSPDPAISVDEISDGVFRLDINPAPKNGSFQLQLTIGDSTYRTVSIPPQATATFVLQAIFECLKDLENAPQFSIMNYGGYGYEIYTRPVTGGQPVAAISAINNLEGFSSLYGTFSMNTAGVEELVSGNAAADAVLEVQADIAGEVQTLIQTNVVILNDLIENNSFDIVDFGQVMPVDSVVRYDTSQALTDAQKLQARENIGAIDAELVTGQAVEINVLQGKATVAEFKIANIEDTLEDNINQPVLTSSSPSFSGLTLSSGSITFADSTTMSTAPVAPNLAPYMQKANNLSDVVSVATARTNLGLGTMAVEAANDYLSKAGNLSGLASASAARTNLGLGTMATQAAANYLAKADNLDGLASVPAARNNLGLGTMSTETAADYLTKAGNLSGLASVSAARTTLGLGTANTPQFAGVVAGEVGGTSASLAAGSLRVVTVGTSDFVVNSGGVEYYSDGGMLLQDASGSTSVRVNQEGGPLSERGVWVGTALGETGVVTDGIVFADGTKQTTASISSSSTIGQVEQYDILSYDWNITGETGIENWTVTQTGGKKLFSRGISGGTVVRGFSDAKGIITTRYPDQEALGFPTSHPSVKISAVIDGTSVTELTVGLFGGDTLSANEPIFAISFARTIDAPTFEESRIFYIHYPSALGTAVTSTEISNSSISPTFGWGQLVELELFKNGKIVFSVPNRSGEMPKEFVINAPTNPTARQFQINAINSKLQQVNFAGVSMDPRNYDGETDFAPSFEIRKYKLHVYH